MINVFEMVGVTLKITKNTEHEKVTVWMQAVWPEWKGVILEKIIQVFTWFFLHSKQPSPLLCNSCLNYMYEHGCVSRVIQQKVSPLFLWVLPLSLYRTIQETTRNFLKFGVLLRYDNCMRVKKTIRELNTSELYY